MCKKTLILSFMCILHVVFSENLNVFETQNVTNFKILKSKERNAQPEITNFSSTGKNFIKRQVSVSSNDQDQYLVPETDKSKTATNYRNNGKKFSETFNEYGEIQKPFSSNKGERLEKFEESNVKKMEISAPNISVISPLHLKKNSQPGRSWNTAVSNGLDYYNRNDNVNKIEDYYLINPRNSKERYSHNKSKSNMIAYTQRVPVFPVVPNPSYQNPNFPVSRISYPITTSFLFNPTVPLPEPPSPPIFPIPVVPKLSNHYPPTPTPNPLSYHNRCFCDKGLVINFNSQYPPCLKEKFKCDKKCFLSPRTQLVSVHTPRMLFPNENILSSTAFVSSPYLHQQF